MKKNKDNCWNRRIGVTDGEAFRPIDVYARILKCVLSLTNTSFLKLSVNGDDIWFEDVKPYPEEPSHSGWGGETDIVLDGHFQPGLSLELRKLVRRERVDLAHKVFML